MRGWVAAGWTWVGGKRGQAVAGRRLVASNSLPRWFLLGFDRRTLYRKQHHTPPDDETIHSGTKQ